jgi:hypothetical protein
MIVTANSVSVVPSGATVREGVIQITGGHVTRPHVSPGQEGTDRRGEGRCHRQAPGSDSGEEASDLVGEQRRPGDGQRIEEAVDRLGVPLVLRHLDAQGSRHGARREVEDVEEELVGVDRVDPEGIELGGRYRPTR